MKNMCMCLCLTFTVTMCKEEKHLMESDYCEKEELILQLKILLGKMCIFAQ